MSNLTLLKRTLSIFGLLLFLTLPVWAADPGCIINTTTLPNGTVSSAYNQTITASNGIGYTYTVTAGVLPNGLSLTAGTGVLSGIPISAGTFSFVIQASNGSLSCVASYTVTICTVMLSPTSAIIGASGGSGMITVTSSLPWTVTFSSGVVVNITSGAGNGVVTYSVLANPGPNPLVHTITIGSCTFYLQQAAPGIIINESFNAGIPSTWAVINGPAGASGSTWRTDNPCNRIGLTTPFVIMDPQCKNSTGVPDDELWMPRFDATGLGQVILQFDSRVRFFGGTTETFDVDVSTDGGNTWPNNVLRIASVDDPPTTKTIDITSVITPNPSNVRIRFHYYRANCVGCNKPGSVDSTTIRPKSVPGQSEKSSPAQQAELYTEIRQVNLSYVKIDPLAVSLQRGIPSFTPAPTLIAKVTARPEVLGTLAVVIPGSISNGATSNGVTVSNLSFNNTTGDVMANVVASCAATTGTFTLRVMNFTNISTDATLTVTTTSNTSPTLGTYPTTTVMAGSNTTVMPTAAPADNGSLSITAIPTGTGQSPFTGTFAVNPTTGVVTVTDAQPKGTYTVTVRAVDDCGLFTTKTFTLTVNNPVACSSNNFSFRAAAGSPITVGLTPASVAVGDFDGDGKQDLVVPNFDSNNVTILLGTVSGAFNPSPGSPFTVGSHPNFAAVGDFDGDGKQDVAVADYSGGDIRILLGNGTGGFKSNTSITTGGVPVVLVVGDFNNDRKQDIAIANEITPVGTVVILLGNGSGGFSQAAGSPINVGNSPASIVVGDFNGDGAQDLAVPNTLSDNVMILRGDGSGGFRPPSTVSVGTHPKSIAVGDFNANGTQDLAVANEGSGNVTILLGNGIGGFNAAGAPVSAGSGPFSVIVGDFDADGKQDLAITNGISNDVTILIGNGSGGFAPATNSPISVGTRPYVIAMGDFNADGKQDLAVVNGNSNNLTVLLNNCAPAIAAASTITRQKGSPSGAAVTIATVSDTETAAGSLTVTATTVPAGITVTSITNMAGTITASVAAGCTAAVGINTVGLTVTDGTNGTATANLTVNVTANTAPALTYANQTVAVGNALTINPATGPSDNGSISTIAVQSVTPSASPGTITVNSTTGVVSVSNNVPVGTYTVTIRATDNCGAITNASFTLTVGCQTIMLTNPVTTTGTVNTAFSQTFTQTGGVGATTFSLNSGTLPTGLTLSAVGVLSGTPTQSGTFNLTIKATDSNGCTGTSTTYALVIGCQTITVTNPVTTNGVVNTALTRNFTQTGGVGTITFSLNSGALPNGLVLSSAGVLSGTPTQSGSFSVTVKATDGNGCFGIGATYTLVISCQTISLTNPATTTGTVNTAFSQSFMQTGGVGATTFSLNSGTSPTGLTLSAGGVLSGTPTQSGTFNLTIKATDSNGCTGTSATYALVIGCQTINVTNPATTTGTVNAAFSQTFTQTGGVGATTFSLNSGPLPTGLTLSTGGLLSGTPTQRGSFPIVIKATDSNGCFGNGATYILAINCPTISLNPGTLPNGQMGATYNQPITASGGVGAYTFGLSSGALPTGITLSSAGLLSGTPTVAGSFPITITATDANNCTSAQGYTLVIASCPVVIVNPATASNGFVGTSYSQSFTQTGGTGTVTWSNTGSLPGGLTLNLTSGVLSGTPTTQNTFNFTIRATDSNGCFGERAYTVTISANSNGLQFYPLPQPVRLLETRAGLTGCTTPGAIINAGATFTLPARTTCAGIPANAQAVTGNITVVPTGGGFLTLFPSSAQQPTVANSNFGPGEVTNNVFTVGLGAADGAFKIFASGTTHVIVDVTGYYAPPAAGGLYFHPLATPVRLLETRAGLNGCIAPGAQLIGTGDPNADPNLDFAVQGRSPVASPCNSIPATAQVLVGNATSVVPENGGFLTIYPSGGTRPLIASSNYGGNDVINGPFAVKLGADGKFKIYTLRTTHLVIDILGYYSGEAVDANGAGLLFNPLPVPVRLLETRADFPNFPLPGCTRTNAPIQGNLNAATHTQPAGNFCGLPASAQAVVGNVSVVSTPGAGFLTLFPGNLTNAPLVATSNYPSPAAAGYNRHYFVGLSPVDGTFKILTQFTTDVILDASGYFAP